MVGSGQGLAQWEGIGGVRMGDVFKILNLKKEKCPKIS